MTRPRVHPRTALLVALALFVSAFAPVVPPCASEVEAPCEEQMDHGAPMDHGSMPMTGHAPVDAPTSEPPRTTLGMPCCMITATVAPRLETSTTLVALAAVTLPALLVVPSVTPPVPVPDARPPDRRIPLHIALGRFLT